MSRSIYCSPRLGLVMFAALGLASIGSPVWAQRGGVMPAAPRVVAAAPSVVKLKEPVASRVYQRDAKGKAEIPIVLDEISSLSRSTHASTA